jgi:hypothetical protein
MDNVNLEELLSRLKEIEGLLQAPAADGHVNKAQTLALSIARKAPAGPISNLAMQVMSEASALRLGTLAVRTDGDKLNALLEKLRLALQEVKPDPGDRTRLN